MQEEELLEKSLNGDKEAMDILVREHWDRVYHHCLQIVQDESMAEDLAQETFVHAFKHLYSFKRRSLFSTWIWRIAHNLSLNYLKKKHRHERPLIEEILPSQEQQEEREFYLRVEEALKTLDEKHRVVFELYHLKQISQKEIATLLNIPHGTVRSRLYYARLKVREYFKRFPEGA
ncbi:MAG: sigma-70 family RNA polymerase sigma factor [Chlamydiales bacterium]|nr:sigma-70 family RNA polymerase sigma factor [Chlamydiales bacterium]